MAVIRQVQQAKQNWGTLYPIGISGKKEAERIWGREAPYDTLFTYLFRRFGPPMTGSDDYKDLCCYILTTSTKGVYVLIRLASYGFTRLTIMVDSKQVLREISLEEFKATDDQYFEDATNFPLSAKAYSAFESLVKNLLKPVGIRDTLFNCMGEVHSGKEMSPFKLAGYPIRINDPNAKLVIEQD